MNIIIDALKAKYVAERLQAVANLQVYLSSAAGVAEHPDIMQTIEDELGKIAEYKDKLEALDTLELPDENQLSFLREDGTSQ